MLKKTILVGVSGGIAGFKSIELIELLKKDNIDTHVIMTQNARKMVPLKELEKASGNKVHTELFEKGFDCRRVLKNHKVEHIDLANRADLLIIVPATANIIGKLASGIADDLLTTTALAFTKTILICPAMNSNMWQNPIVRENIDKLKNFGYQIIGPTNGKLACGSQGQGRLENVKIIRDEIINLLNKSESLKGKKIIVTAGGTIEKIDDVRSITNRSSGKMGIAIAHECYLRGAEILLLRAKNSVLPRYIMSEKIFTTSEDLLQFLKIYANYYDTVFHTAAVSDFKVAKVQTGKISSRKSINLKLIPRAKILDQIKKLNPKIKLIAFKAEYGLPEKKLIEVSYKRLTECKADAIIANDVSKNDRGFEANTNEVYVIVPDKTVKKIPLAPKKIIAGEIIDCVFYNQAFS